MGRGTMARPLAGIGAAVVCMTSCGEDRREAAPTATPAPPVPAPVPAPEPEVPRDVQVITAVLQDLLDYSGQDSPVARRGVPPARLLFDPEPRLSYRQEGDVLHERDGDPCAGLLPAEAIGARQAVADLGSGGRKETWSGVPRDSRVRLFGSSTSGSEGGDEPERRSRFDDRPIAAWPPGFSRDGTVAVVCLGIPWSMHSSLASFVLTRTAGVWTVRVRQFVYYL